MKTMKLLLVLAKNALRKLPCGLSTTFCNLSHFFSLRFAELYLIYFQSFWPIYSLLEALLLQKRCFSWYLSLLFSKGKSLLSVQVSESRFFPTIAKIWTNLSSWLMKPCIKSKTPAKTDFVS